MNNVYCIHFDKKEIRVSLDLLQKYLDQGWKFGFSWNHCKNSSSAHKGHSPSNKGRTVPEETKRKISETLKRKYDQGLEIGFRTYWKSSHDSWCKGLTKETDQRVMNISIGKMGHEVSKETRKKLHDSHYGKKIPKDKLEIILSKWYITKKLNNSFNYSKPEQMFYETLLELNKKYTIYRQYKDKERYPFYCDFYIEELDLFIEMNFHWSHGKHPFDKYSSEDISTLNEWLEKSNTSKYFSNSIEVWTKRDVNKRLIAAKNNLNYIELFDEEDVKKLLEKLK